MISTIITGSRSTTWEALGDIRNYSGKTFLSKILCDNCIISVNFSYLKIKPKEELE